MSNQTPKKSVLLMGPVPPPLGGTTASFMQLLNDLARQDQLETLVVSTQARKEKTVSSLLLEPLGTLGRLCHLIPRYDLVSFHASNRRMLYFGCLLLLLCKAFRKPLMLRMFGGSFHHVYENSRGLTRRLYTFLFRADKILLETQQMVTFFAERFPQADLVWFANSRPVTACEQVEARNVTKPIRFIFLGHVKPPKGVRDLIGAAKELSCREQDFVIDVYGPLQEGMQEREFEGSAIHYRGVLELEQVETTLKTYDLLILPTHYFGEGYPGVILEAFSAGLPVIASDWQAIPEIVGHGVNGLLFEPKNVAALAKAIERILTEPELLASLRSGARQSAERFSSAIWHEQVFVDLCLSTAK